MDKPGQITVLLHGKEFPGAQVLKRGHYLHRLNRLLARLLDNDLKLHCRVGNICDQYLIIYADSAAWASRLRYQLPSLLKRLRAHKGLAELNRIEVKVLPKEERHQTKRRARMSREAADCINACAAALPDGSLSSALKRLASHRPKGEDN